MIFLGHFSKCTNAFHLTLRDIILNALRTGNISIAKSNKEEFQGLRRQLESGGGGGARAN